MNFVLSLTKPQLEAFTDYYKQTLKKAPDSRIQAYVKTDRLSITIYVSGKVMFQGKDAEAAFLFWQDTFNLTPETVASNSMDDYFTPSIGSDESGAGDYFGPLTVAAAYVKKGDNQRLSTLGIKDSKALSDRQIRSLAPKLMAQCQYALLVLDNKKYNAMIEKKYNAHKLKAHLHAQCHNHLIKKIVAKPKVIVDQFVAHKHYMNYLEDFNNPVIPDIIITKAESHYASVAIASIIARYAYLIHMDRLSERVGFALQKGVSEKVEKQAKILLDTKGIRFLGTVAKTHFKTTKKIMGE